MIRVLLDGRLGNNLFQIATGLALAATHKTGLVVDPCMLPRIRRQDDLKRMPVLKMAFPRHLASVRLNRIIQDTFGKNIHELLGRSIYQETSLDFDPAVDSLGPNAILRGFYQNERYFLKIADDLNRWFDLSPWLDQAPATYRAAVSRERSVGIHVRRTDYLRHENGPFLVCDMTYYQTAMDRMRSLLRNPEFVVVSDDPGWCRHHLDGPDTTVVDFQDAPFRMLVDLALFSACQHQIIANSSFSWWGAWLNPNLKRIVIGPERWMNDGAIPIRSKTMRGFETVRCEPGGQAM